MMRHIKFAKYVSGPFLQYNRQFDMFLSFCYLYIEVRDVLRGMPHKNTH